MIIAYKKNKSKPITFEDGTTLMLYPAKKHYTLDDKYRDDGVIKKLVEDKIIKIIVNKKIETQKDDRKRNVFVKKEEK